MFLCDAMALCEMTTRDLRACSSAMSSPLNSPLEARKSAIERGGLTCRGIVLIVPARRWTCRDGLEESRKKIANENVVSLRTWESEERTNECVLTLYGR